MHRQPLLEQLENYRERFPHEAGTAVQLADFVRSTPDCFEREHLAGHVTGSALVVDRSRSRVLLMHHAKLGKWLQMGGHSDGDPDTPAVALREAQEETGLERLEMVCDQPFDLDIHEIPARGQEPAHLHYDVRYLVVGDPEEPLTINSESRGLRWFSLQEAQAATQEQSMLRQFAKALKPLSEKVHPVGQQVRE